MHLFIHAAERENAFLMLVWKMGPGSIFSKSNAKQKSKEFLEFLTFQDVIVFRKRITSHRGAGQDLRGKKQPDILGAVDALLQRLSLAPNAIEGICVLSGPGQFSFLRSSVVVANTFGWALRIPVIGIESAEFATEKEFVEKGLKKISRTKHFQPIMPAYGKEPNITMPRPLSSRPPGGTRGKRPRESSKTSYGSL